MTRLFLLCATALSLAGLALSSVALASVTGEFAQVLVLIVGLFTLNFQVFLPLMAKEVFHGGAGLVGVFSAMQGAGALVASLLLGSFGFAPQARAATVASAKTPFVEIGVDVDEDEALGHVKRLVRPAGGCALHERRPCRQRRLLRLARRPA